MANIEIDYPAQSNNLRNAVRFKYKNRPPITCPPSNYSRDDAYKIIYEGLTKISTNIRKYVTMKNTNFNERQEILKSCLLPTDEIQNYELFHSMEEGKIGNYQHRCLKCVCINRKNNELIFVTSMNCNIVDPQKKKESQRPGWYIYESRMSADYIWWKTLLYKL